MYHDKWRLHLIWPGAWICMHGSCSVTGINTTANHTSMRIKCPKLNKYMYCPLESTTLVVVMSCATMESKTENTGVRIQLCKCQETSILLINTEIETVISIGWHVHNSLHREQIRTVSRSMDAQYRWQAWPHREQYIASRMMFVSQRPHF